MAVVTANPKTAGVARWIFLALWGVKLGKGKKAATQYTTKVGGGVGSRLWVRQAACGSGSCASGARNMDGKLITQCLDRALHVMAVNKVFAVGRLVVPVRPPPCRCLTRWWCSRVTRERPQTSSTARSVGRAAVLCCAAM